MNPSPSDLPRSSSRSPAAQPAGADSAPSAANLESPFKGIGGGRRIVNALHYSMRGLVSAWRIESAFRQELSLALILIPAAWLLPVPMFQVLALISSVLVVLIVELINSSIEAAVDRISLDHHRLSGRAKDLGSAAVFLTLVMCFLAWALIAGPVLVHWIVTLR